MTLLHQFPVPVAVPAAVPSADVPPVAPHYRPRPVDDDPFAAPGIKSGAFVLRPAIEFTAGYDTNAARTFTPGASSFFIVAPELQLKSDWQRHELSANLRGSYSTYEAIPFLNRPAADARVNGRIDVTRDTRVDLEGRLIVGTDNPGSPDLTADLAKLPIYTTVGTTAGVAQRFNRFEISVKGTFDRTQYQDSLLTNGVTFSNAGRNFNQYGTLLRGSYELTPGVKPFVEVDADTRIHDLPFDAFGMRRDSNGVTTKVGTTFELTRKLTGEIAVGALERTYKDPTLPDLRGTVFDGSLLWSATALTSFKLTAATTAAESTLVGVSGVLRHDASVEMQHAFRWWLIGSVKFGKGHDDYVGLGRIDDRYAFSTALTYKLNRTVQLKGEYRQEWLRSNQPGNDYVANVFLVGLKLQR